MIEHILFYLIAAIVLISALVVVSLRNIVRAVFLFFVVLFAMAGLFVFTLADFVAITQVVVYVGGVLVLMIFAFLLSDREMLNLETSSGKTTSGIHNLGGKLIGVLFFAVLLISIQSLNVDKLSWITNSQSNQLLPSDNTIHYLGINMMTRYLVPFELISIVLLMVLIGAVHLARKEKHS